MRTLLAAAVLAALFAAGASAQYSFQPESPEVVELQGLYGGNGYAFPTASFPLFREDLFRFARSLAGQLPEGDSRDEVDAYANRFAPRPDPVVSANPDATYQWTIGVPPGPVSFTDKLEREDPLFAIRLGLQVDNSLLLSIRDVTRKEYRLDPAGSNFPPAVPQNPFARENNSVQEGFLRFLTGPLDVTIGRQPVHLGPAEDTSVAVSTRIPFLDAARIRMPVGPLTMTWLVSTLENRRATEDQSPIPGLPGYGYGQTIILYGIHYFEWAFRTVRAGIGAQYLVSRPYNALQLSDIFPVFSWHNADINPNNMCLIGDVSWVPLPGLSLYLQFGLDDVNLSASGIADSGVPTIDAEILGVSYHASLAPGWPLAVALTGGHTHYLWGNFDAKAPLDDYLSRAIYRMDLWSDVESTSLTSPYGPGTLWVSAKARVASPWGGTAALSCAYVLKNPAADLEHTPYKADSVVANTPLVGRGNVAIDLGYRIGRNVSATFTVEGWFDPSSTWLSVALGADVKFPGT